MFSIDNFIEIQVVGFLLLLAISPIINLLSKDLRTQEGFCPFFENIPDKSAKAILLLVLAFSVGIAGNRLVDELFDNLNIEGKESFQCERNCLIPIFCSEKVKNCPVENKTDFGKYYDNNPGTLRDLKLAEYFVSDNSKTAQDYFLRHKSFMRVLRGAAFASFFLLCSMFLYQLVKRNKNFKSCDRYNYSHFLTVFAFFLIFASAYYYEAEHYYNRVVEMYTEGYFEQKKPFKPE